MKRLITYLLALLSFCFSVAYSRAQTTIEILVNNRGANAVMKYDEHGNYLGDFISPGSGGLSGPEDILFHPDGSVLVTGFNNASIKKYDGATGTYIADFSSGYSLSSPSKMSIGPDSLIYVTQWGASQNKVARFDLNGNFVDEFTAIGAPKGLGHTWDKNGNFYISLYANGGDGTVHKFNSTGQDMGTFINSSILQGPTNIWFDDNGDMLIEDWTTGVVRRYDSTGQYINNFVIGMTNPEGIAFLPDGRMLIGDWGLDAVHLVNTDGTLAGLFCSGNGMTDPNCVRVRTVPANTAAGQLLKEDGVRIYPSVGRDFIIEGLRGAVTKADILIINTGGSVVERRLAAFLPTRWDARTYPTGMYTVLLKTPGGEYLERIIVSD